MGHLEVGCLGPARRSRSSEKGSIEGNQEKDSKWRREAGDKTEHKEQEEEKHDENKEEAEGEHKEKPCVDEESTEKAGPSKKITVYSPDEEGKPGQTLNTEEEAAEVTDGENEDDHKCEPRFPPKAPPPGFVINPEELQKRLEEREERGTKRN